MGRLTRGEELGKGAHQRDRPEDRAGGRGPSGSSIRTPDPVRAVQMAHAPEAAPGPPALVRGARLRPRLDCHRWMPFAEWKACLLHIEGRGSDRDALRARRESPHGAATSWPKGHLSQGDIQRRRALPLATRPRPHLAEEPHAWAAASSRRLPPTGGAGIARRRWKHRRHDRRAESSSVPAASVPAPAGRVPIGQPDTRGLGPTVAPTGSRRRRSGLPKGAAAPPCALRRRVLASAAAEVARLGRLSS